MWHRWLWFCDVIFLTPSNLATLSSTNMNVTPSCIHSCIGAVLHLLISDKSLSVAIAYTKVVQLGIHLQDNQNIIVAVCGGCVVLWFARQTIMHNALCVHISQFVCTCSFSLQLHAAYLFSKLWI